MSIAEIMAEIVASMKRSKEDAAQRAARAAAYTGPERRRAPRIRIVDDVPPAQRLAEMEAAKGKP